MRAEGEEGRREGGEWPEAALERHCTSVRPAHPRRPAGNAATPDASKAVRGSEQTRRGHGEQGWRPSLRLLMSFSLVAEGRGRGEAGGGRGSRGGALDVVDCPRELA